MYFCLAKLENSEWVLHLYQRNSQKNILEKFRNVTIFLCLLHVTQLFILFFFISWFCSPINDLLMNFYYHPLRKENLLSFNSTHEILISNFCLHYWKNINYIHYESVVVWEFYWTVLWFFRNYFLNLKNREWCLHECEFHMRRFARFGAICTI